MANSQKGKSDNKRFTFKLYCSNDGDDQIQVTVYGPTEIKSEKIEYSIRQSNEFKPKFGEARELTHKLEPDMLNSSPPKRLVFEPPHLRIDSQQVSRGLRILDQKDQVVWRNIHIQNGSHSFSVTKITQGAQLCFIVGYQRLLCKYLQEGLLDSLNNAVKYVILVKIERRKKKTTVNWTEVNLTEQAIDTLKKQIEKRLNKKNELKSMKSKRSQNTIHVTKATSMITRAVSSIVENVLKLFGRRISVTKLPAVSKFMRIFFGVSQAQTGDIAGAVAAAASDVLAEIPGLGTALSAAVICGWLFLKDKQRLQIGKIKVEMADFVPESPMFGKDFFGDSFYDESEIAYTDDISKIHIKSSDLIEGIQIEYEFRGKSAYHGGQEGTLKTMVLDPNEKITAVEVSIYCDIVSSLTFYTDMGRTETFGEERKHVYLYELADGNYLAAIKGYDMFKNKNGEAIKSCPTLPGNREVLPAIGFTAKF